MMDRRGSSSTAARNLALGLAIDATRAETEEIRDGDGAEPVSPVRRMFREPRFSLHVVTVCGLSTPVDLAVARAGFEANLALHPRFCSIQVLDEPEKGETPRWVRTTVNLDDHLIFPDLDQAATSADPDRALEDYVASLSTLPMDHSRPLWELHALDFPTTDTAAACVIRVHHSLGDSRSCPSSSPTPAASPTLLTRCRRRPCSPRRPGPVYALPPRPPLFSLATVAVWVMSVLVLAWHTVVDVACFAATAMSILVDPPTVFTGADGVEFRPKRFVNRTLSLDDVKYVKNTMNCTVNDVLLGVASAALSRYYFRRTGESDRKKVNVRTALIVNLRQTSGLPTLASMTTESGKKNNNGAKWGNQVGYMTLPFPIAKHEDVLEYVRSATMATGRKKNSMESVFTYWSAAMTLKILGTKAAASLCYGVIRNTTLLFSNVVGPREQMVFFGHPVVYIAPSVYGHPTALTVHYQSYMNIIKLVMAVDEAQFPDSHQLLDDFAESLRLIREAASFKKSTMNA